MLSTSAVQGHSGVRGLLITLAAVATLMVGMPGLQDAFSIGTVLISIVGGVAVGFAALAVRATRTGGHDRVS